MKKIKKTENLVYKVLKDNKLARKDDFILIGSVLKKCGVDLNMPLGVFLATHINYDIPSFETITRCRRKIAEQEPEMFTAETLCARYNLENDFKEHFSE